MHFPKQKDTKSRFAGRNLLQSLAPNLSAQVGTDTRIMLWQISCPPIIRRIIEGFIQKRRQRSLLPCGGAKFIQLLAALAILHQEKFKEQDDFILFLISSWCNSSFSSYHPGQIHPFLFIILVQTASTVKELDKFCPSNSSDDLCLLFCTNSFMILLMMGGHDICHLLYDPSYDRWARYLPPTV